MKSIGGKIIILQNSIACFGFLTNINNLTKDPLWLQDQHQFHYLRQFENITIFSHLTLCREQSFSEKDFPTF